MQARAGDRSRYRPVESVLTPGLPGDALALVQAYRDVVGARECYVADLDAIEGGQLQRDRVRDLVRAAAPCSLLVDAGTGDENAAGAVRALGAAAVVVGLETLRRLEDLAAIVATLGPERVIFSLDLRLGRPVLSPHAAAAGDLRGLEPEEVAGRAVAAGVRTLIALDVGRVGTGRGMDLELLRRLRRRFPSVRLLAGGGVADGEDLARLAGVGCDAALVATALHRGRIGQSRTSGVRQVADCP